jgi:hypothetical protein
MLRRWAERQRGITQARVAARARWATLIGLIIENTESRGMAGPGTPDIDFTKRQSDAGDSEGGEEKKRVLYALVGPMGSDPWAKFRKWVRLLNPRLG